MIGTATAFVFATAVVGLLVDQDGGKSRALGANWTLRGQVNEFPSKLPEDHRT